MIDKNDGQGGAFQHAREIINKDTSIPDEEKEGILKLIQVLVEAADPSPYSREKNKQFKTLKQEMRLVKNSRAAHIFLYSHGKLAFGSSLNEEGLKNQPLSTPRKDGLTS